MLEAGGGWMLEGGSRNRECRWRQAGIGGGILVEKSFLAERI